MATGIAGQIAPEFRFDNWLANTDGDLKIADIEAVSYTHLTLPTTPYV